MQRLAVLAALHGLHCVSGLDREGQQLLKAPELGVEARAHLLRAAPLCAALCRATPELRSCAKHVHVPECCSHVACM